MSLLVTGASGFVGLNLVQRALAAGETVVGLSTTAIDAACAVRLGLPHARFVEVVGDVRDRALVDRVIAGHRVDRIVHMAAITASTARERVAGERIVDVNLVGLATVIAAAAQAGVRRFVAVGSIAVFGGVPPDGSLMDEGTSHAPQSLYAITKSAGDAITARLGALHGLDWVIARLGRVFGPFEHDTGVRDTLSQIHQVSACALAGRSVAFERPCRKNWSYAPDVATHLLMLADAPQVRHRVYHLGADRTFTLADWCGRLRQRIPTFDYRIGPDATGDETIDLGGARDSGLLSWQRFADEFRPPPCADLDTAFDGTLRAMTGTDAAAVVGHH